MKEKDKYTDPDFHCIHCGRDYPEVWKTQEYGTRCGECLSAYCKRRYQDKKAGMAHLELGPTVPALAGVDWDEDFNNRMLRQI